MNGLGAASLLACAVASLSQAAGGDERRPLFKDFMGINGHFTFRPPLYRPLTRLVRNYHNMDWDVAKPGDSLTFPMCVNGVNWKDLYGAWRKEGYEIDVCLQFGRFGGGDPESMKLWEGKEDWARSYGLRMAQVLGPSGPGGLCSSIEIGNEPGRKFDDALYRRIFIAMAEGIREGDPQVKIATCAVHARKADDYLKSLDETFSSPEALKLLDVISTHVYAIKPRGSGRHPWERSHPEDPALDYLKVVDEIVAWRDKKAPGRQVWVTEFGWDACTPEAMGRRSGWFKKLGWTGVTELQQAQYLVRSFFLFAERGVDRAYIYYYDDNDEPSVHASSGLTRRFRPKPAYWAVRHLHALLGEYRMSRVVQGGPDGPCVYEFARGDGGASRIWAVWFPSGAGLEREAALKGLPGRPLRVEGMPVEEGGAPVVEWKPAGSREIRLVVSESPLYVVMEP